MIDREGGVPGFGSDNSLNIKGLPQAGELDSWFPAGGCFGEVLGPLGGGTYLEEEGNQMYPFVGDVWSPLFPSVSASCRL